VTARNLLLGNSLSNQNLSLFNLISTELSSPIHAILASFSVGVDPYLYAVLVLQIILLKYFAV